MNTIGKIVGINLAILALYCIGVSFMDGFEKQSVQAFFLGIIFIPTHFLVCLITATVKYFTTKGSGGQRNLEAKGYLLSALVVLIVGFSVCMAMIL